MSSVSREPVGESQQSQLTAAVLKAAQSVGAVPKNGFNHRHNYPFATEADVGSAARAALAKAGLWVWFDVEDYTEDVAKSSTGGRYTFGRMRVRCTVTHAASGESRSFAVIGAGVDSGEKACYKAMTGAVKYALMKLLLIDTGERSDPEHSSDEPEPPAAARRAPAPPARPDAPSPAQHDAARARGASRTAPARGAGFEMTDKKMRLLFARLHESKDRNELRNYVKLAGFEDVMEIDSRDAFEKILAWVEAPAAADDDDFGAEVAKAAEGAEDDPFGEW